MKKLVIFLIMFISLLCIDINIVSAANNSIVINHSPVGEDELNNNVKYFNTALLSYVITNDNGEVASGYQRVSYGTPFEICSKEEYCLKGNTVTIKLSSIKASFISSSMTLNNENVNYSELEDEVIEYSFTIENDTDDVGVINYTTEPGIDDSIVSINYKDVDPNYMVSDHSFMLYVDTGIAKLSIASIPANGYGFYLNDYVKEVKSENTYYLVPMNSYREEIVSYDIGYRNPNNYYDIIIDESIDIKPKLNDLDTAIKITPKENQEVIYTLNVKEPSNENISINLKSSNEFEIPLDYFDIDRYHFTFYLYAYDEINEEYVLYDDYEKVNLDELKIGLIPGQKYLISTCGADFDDLDMEYFEYNNGAVEKNKKLKNMESSDSCSINNLEKLKENSIEFEVKEGDNPTLDLYGNAYGTMTYALKYLDLDPNGLTHATKTHYVYFARGKYYKLLSEKDGIRKYLINLDCTEEKGTECVSNEKLKVDVNGYTTIYYPYTASHYFAYNDFDGDFRPGTIVGNMHSGGGSLIDYTDRIYYSVYQNPYALKEIKKVDQNGKPVDAKFEITTERNGYHMKFLYNHYDEREINGKIYKNVYEVKDAIVYKNGETVESTEDSIIETKDGEFILYYPVTFMFKENIDPYKSPGAGYNLYNSYRLNRLDIKELETSTGHIITKDITSLYAEAGFGYTPESVTYADPLPDPLYHNNTKNLILTHNIDNFDLDKYIIEHWDDDNYYNEYKTRFSFDKILENVNYEYLEDRGVTNVEDYKQTRTIVNKKVPTIKKTIEGNGPKDKEYTFLVYEKESNELVEEIKVKANEEGYLDITKLVDGKTYIIREKIDSDDYTNTKIEVLNGEAKEDKDGKYYEFIYDEELTKVYEAKFYNKYKDITVPDTGDNIIMFIVLGIISLISIVLVVLKLKKVNK